MLPIRPPVPQPTRSGSPSLGTRLITERDPYASIRRTLFHPSSSDKLNYTNEYLWNLAGKANPEETLDQKVIRTFTNDIQIYKFVPYLYLVRASSFFNLRHPVLAIGDCCKAIRLVEIATGYKHAVGQSVCDTNKVMEMNAEYCSECLVEESQDWVQANDLSALARDAAYVLLEAANLLGANLDSLEDILKSVFVIVPNFMEEVWAPYYDKVMAEAMIDKEMKADMEFLKKKGRVWTAVVENMNEELDTIELSRETLGLRTVLKYMKKVDPKLQVSPMKSVELTWDGEDNDQQQGTTHMGMIAQYDIPMKAKISHDKTDIVIQDTGNTKAPYRCDNCWKVVYDFGPTSGLVCCYHATVKRTGAPMAPTVYCNEMCRYENRHLHEQWHQAETNTAYKAAAEDNDFPLFVARLYTLKKGTHPLKIAEMQCTLAQFGPQTRHEFSIQRDLIDPWDALLELNLNIFGDLRFETWVLLSLKHKWDNNKRIKGGLKLVFPIRAMYNHSCDSNAMVAMALSKGAGKNVATEELPLNQEVVYARREIREGEEVTISYIGGGATAMPRKQRALELSKIGIGYCECLYCYRQREEEGKKRGRGNKK
ncbi:hypothetical protein L211DRAFT_839203 [Terfezia boudieri ATCC MYA-4762]|uniref:SET domain-containing protein n=1 Tax=Terfezia boudieri ATCC MYA-4762 TaxID=1051890 RepID=A0A3N4LIW3_9PEZI|nr:hypothetical protein L211DRAFT_839203 [Terfezia boudieri ATCC MYA-4762]